LGVVGDIHDSEGVVGDIHDSEGPSGRHDSDSPRLWQSQT
jgi:hypothetical protein